MSRRDALIDFLHFMVALGALVALIACAVWVLDRAIDHTTVPALQRAAGPFEDGSGNVVLKLDSGVEVTAYYCMAGWPCEGD